MEHQDSTDVPEALANELRALQSHNRQQDLEALSFEKRLARLENTVQRLSDYLASSASAEQGNVANQPRPPHY